MKILYVSNALIPSNQANSIQIMRMCEAFAEEGHEVTLLCNGSGPPEMVFFHYGCRTKFRLVRLTAAQNRGGTALRLLRLLGFLMTEGGRYDLAYGRYPLGLALCAVWRIPLILETHAIAASRGRRWLEDWLLRRSRFRLMVAISQALADDYRTRYPQWLAGNRILVAHDGVAVADGTVPPAVPSGDRVKIGYVGSFYAGKGAEWVALLADSLPQFDFELVGGGTDTLVKLLPPGWRAPSNLRVHPAIAPAAVPARLREMDILLLPAQPVTTVSGQGNIARWMSPLKLFEYMASGRPLIASDLPVFREVLAADVDALIVPPTDLSAWRAAILQLAGDAGFRRSLAERAHAKVVAKFTWRGRVREITQACQ